MVHTLIMTVHIIVCITLIGIVLLQQGKGADMGAVFGGSSQTLFGSSGATTLLGKLTAAAAVIFMLTSLGLTYQATNRYKASVMPDQPKTAAPAPIEEAAPQAQPVAQPVAEQPQTPAEPAAEQPQEQAQPPAEAAPKSE